MHQIYPKCTLSSVARKSTSNRLRTLPASSTTLISSSLSHIQPGETLHKISLKSPLNQTPPKKSKDKAFPSKTLNFSLHAI